MGNDFFFFFLFFFILQNRCVPKHVIIGFST
jgi:hypothetical protein